MGVVHELSDVDPIAISLVKRGANRKRFFLRKAADDEQLLELPGAQRLIKTADWSAVYCVVAEPGALEDAGLVGDRNVPDRWASEDEIRKAAHRFMRNGALVNAMHESLERYGTVVENAVALADFEVEGHTIKKGSWYVAIAPNDVGRAAIESGEWTGVSIEGTGVRTPVAKRESSVEERQRLAREGKALPDGSFPIVTVADLRNAVQAFGRAKDKDAARRHIIRRARALGRTDLLPDAWRVRKGSSSDSGTLGPVDGLLKRIAKRVGVSDEEIAQAAGEGEGIAKAASFGERIAADKLDQELPKGMDLLREVIWRAVRDPEIEDPMPLIRKSVSQFCDWAEGLLSDREAVAKQAALLESEGSTPDAGTTESEVEDEMAWTDEEKERIERLEKRLEELPDVIAKAVAEAKGKEEPKAPTPDELKKSVEEIDGKLDEIRKGVEALGQGESKQGEDDKPSPEQLAKAYETLGIDPALRGVL